MELANKHQLGRMPRLPWLVSYVNNLFFNSRMELHVAENHYHILGRYRATCSFHKYQFFVRNKSR